MIVLNRLGLCWGFFGFNLVKLMGLSNVLVVNFKLVFFKWNMVDISGVFLNIVCGVFVVVEVEFLGKDG